MTFKLFQKESGEDQQEPLLERQGQVSGVRGVLCKWKTKWEASSTRASLVEYSPRNLLIMSIVFGLGCGVLSLAYSYTLTCLLDLIWKHIPEYVVKPLLENYHSQLGVSSPGKVAWVYIMVAAMLFGALNGVSRRLLGYPGDMPHTIAMVHSHGSLPIQEVPPMFFCSLSSVTSGSSLGPEAPLLAICASTVSWVSKTVFGHSGRMLRSCTLMGMASGLSAFFGVSFGGAIFAFEVLHTRGLQFYESLSYAVLSSLLCLAVYRGLWALKAFGAVWTFDEVLQVADTRHIAVGLIIGFIGIALTYLYNKVFAVTKFIFAKLKLVESERPIFAGLLGGLLFGIIGIFLPPTMFWGEFEMETIADDSVPLNHVWPKGGFWGLDAFMSGNYTMRIWFAIGFAKLVTIAVTSVSGLRGGFIFPLMLAGMSIGRGLSAIPNIPWWSDAVPASLPAIALAGALCTGITRTPFACALILTALAGVPAATAPTLLACLVVFYATMTWPFIKTQKDREDIAFLDLRFPGEEPEVEPVAPQIDVVVKNVEEEVPVVDVVVSDQKAVDEGPSGSDEGTSLVDAPKQEDEVAASDS